jgi:hypothetical protein
MAYNNQNPQLHPDQQPRRNELNTSNPAGIIIALIVILVIVGLFVYDDNHRGNVTPVMNAASSVKPQFKLQHVPQVAPAASQNTTAPATANTGNSHQ